MADFTQIIQEINDDINTNGVGAIRGAKLNEVLRDMIAAVNAEKQDPLTIDATPTEGGTNPVQSGGVYDALEGKADKRSFEVLHIHQIPIDIASGLLVGDFVVDTSDGRRLYVVTYRNANDFWLVTSNGVNLVWYSYENNQYSDEGFFDSSIVARDIEEINNSLAGKQDTISDLATIRSGAAAGATAVQPSDLATVATSGSYNDLQNKPTIPAAQVNSDWNANSGVAQILNKPTIPAAQVQSDWNEADNTKVDYIKNKPTIPNVSGKADKVNGATNGDFAGLDNNGNLVDTGFNEDDFSLKVVFFDVSTTPSSMLPNKVYRFGTLSGDTTFPAFTAVPSGDTEVKIWCWTFTTPSTAPTITWPSGITSWAGGSAPTINASKSYEVSVMDGFATIIEN